MADNPDNPLPIKLPSIPNKPNNYYTAGLLGFAGIPLEALQPQFLVYATICDGRCPPNLGHYFDRGKKYCNIYTVSPNKTPEI